MHFTCQKNELSRAIATVSRAISKTQQTVLDAILFEARPGEVTLRAMDNTLCITTTIGAEVRESGRIAVPAKILGNFVNHLPDAEVTIMQPSERMIEIRCQAVRITQQLMNQEEYPAVPPVQSAKALHVPSDVMTDMINGTIFAAASAEDRPILTGLLFDVHPEALRLAAVDGYRMAVREEVVASEVEGQYVIPARALREISHALSDSSGDLHIYFENGRVMFATDSTQVIAQLLQGKYVAYESYFPQSYSTHVQVDRAQLRESLERALIIAGQNASAAPNQIQLKLRENVMEIGATAQTASSDEQIPTVMRGEDLTITLNGRYLMDVLKVIDDAQITVTFNTPTTPVAVQRKGIQSYRYLILPILTRGA